MPADEEGSKKRAEKTTITFGDGGLGKVSG